MSRALVRTLRARNVDVITAREAGMLERGDEEHLEAAAAGGRVLLTSNAADFYRIHTAWLRVGIPRRPDPGASAAIKRAHQFLRALAEKFAEDIEGFGVVSQSLTSLGLGAGLLT